MGERRKRERPEEDVEAVAHQSDNEDSPNKKPRKETNASARRSLFVRSLPSTVTSDALTKLFSESYPLKHATVVLDPETKQSKGYGFVTFADAEDAERAKAEFHGHAFQGRKLKVEVAEPRHRDVDSGKGTSGKKSSTISAEAAATKKARSEKMQDDRKPPKLIIRNLPWSVKEPKDLELLFQKFGKVKHVTLPKVKDTQAGFGFVVMRGKKNAEKALEAVNGNLVDGRILAVDWAVEKDVWEKAKTDAGDAPKPKKEMKAKGEKADKKPEKKAEKTAEKKDDEDPNDVDADVANFMKNFGQELESEPEDSDEDMDKDDENEDDNDEDDDMEDAEEDFDENDVESDTEDEEAAAKAAEAARRKANHITDNSSTLFVRNLPFTVLDPELKEHFNQFGPVRYARVVMDRATDRPKGTGFVCFFNVEDADSCVKGAPKYQAATGANAIKKVEASNVKHSILQNESADSSGLYTLDGRVLQVSHAVEREQAVKLTEQGINIRDNRDKDKRRLYLLNEGTVAAGTPLYNSLSPAEVKMREDSAKQRKKLIQGNPTLHLSLTRLSIRNLPRNINSKDLKALAREAVVGFAKDVRAGLRQQLSKEEEARGGDEMREAEQRRKDKGKGIVKQSKIVFEGREGAKVTEESGAGRSRGYGFIEYTSHRWALMGLRWLNGHATESSTGKKQRLIVEFAIENAQVVDRRKEREEKARLRSKEVLEQREQAVAEGKKPEKKAYTKDQLMAKTRKGQKAPPKPKGKPRAEGKEWKGRPGQFNKGKPVEKGGGSGRDGPKPTNAKGKVQDRTPRAVKGGQAGDDKTKFKPGFAEGEEGRLARRAQIIQKKRQMRRARKA